MAKLKFDGQTHQLTLIADNGAALGTWPAYNNVDPHATLRHLPNRTYTVQDRLAPRHHVANANGPYGSHGIIRFNVPGHPGIGVHSGRAHERRQPGPDRSIQPWAASAPRMRPCEVSAPRCANHR